MKKGEIIADPKELKAIFIALLGCMDGRPLRSLVYHLERIFGHYVWPDGILRPGMDKLGSEATEEQFAELQKQIDISKHHGSKTIYVAGHAHCAGNPTNDPEEQKQQTRDLAERVKNKNPNEEVIALFMFPEGDPNTVIWSMEVLEVL